MTLVLGSICEAPFSISGPDVEASLWKASIAVNGKASVGGDIVAALVLSDRLTEKIVGLLGYL